jgi:hypothetical protein
MTPGFYIFLPIWDGSQFPENNILGALWLAMGPLEDRVLFPTAPADSIQVPQVSS